VGEDGAGTFVAKKVGDKLGGLPERWLVSASRYGRMKEGKKRRTLVCQVGSVSGMTHLMSSIRISWTVFMKTVDCIKARGVRSAWYREGRTRKEKQ
jgi:hypothetical protein